jgi:excisionase family DNA binding protein
MPHHEASARGTYRQKGLSDQRPCAALPKRFVWASWRAEGCGHGSMAEPFFRIVPGSGGSAPCKEDFPELLCVQRGARNRKFFHTEAIDTFQRSILSSASSVPGTNRMNTTHISDIITIDELAGLLRLNRKTVYAAIARGDIPGVRRIRGVLRVSRSAVLSWIASGQGSVSCSPRRGVR